MTYLNEEIIQQMLEVKLIELKYKLKTIKMSDLVSYLLDVILKTNTVKNMNDVAFFIFNIKINKLVEHINVRAILDKSSSIENDLNDILKG